MGVPVNHQPRSSSAKRPKRWSRLIWWIPGLLSFVLWLSLALRHLMLYGSPWRTLKSLARATWFVIDHSTPGLAIGAVSALLVVVLFGTGVIRRDQRPLSGHVCVLRLPSCALGSRGVFVRWIILMKPMHQMLARNAIALIYQGPESLGSSLKCDIFGLTTHSSGPESAAAAASVR